MNFIIELLEGITYYFQLFFFAPAPFARFFQIVFAAQIILLIVTTLRPKKWKWITLFASEFIYLIGGIVVVSGGYADDNVFSWFYGIIAIVLAIIMAAVTLACAMRNAPAKASDVA